MTDDLRSLLALGALSAAACLLAPVRPAHAGVLASFDAAAAGAGVEPNELTPAWALFGTPMVNDGTRLIQDNTSDDPATTYGRYQSPAFPGLMKRGAGEYGIEFRVRPLSDMPYLGSSHYANLAVFWRDDAAVNPQHVIHIDKDTDDAGPGTTGGISYGQDSFYHAVTGIDWSVPHTVFIGYTGSSDVFSIYLDGVFQNNFGAASMSRADGGFPIDTVSFGDTTTGQGLDLAAEWYSVRLLDTAVVPEPALAGLSAAAGALLLPRGRRSRR